MCAKVSYGYRAAHEIIGKCKRAHSSGHKKIPMRAYYCEKCKQWHLTSQRGGYDE